MFNCLIVIFAISIVEGFGSIAANNADIAAREADDDEEDDDDEENEENDW